MNLNRDLAPIIIAAHDKNLGIGKNRKLPWHIPEDLKNFKKITQNEAVIMGRKTWESLPIQPLPNRLNIVISSQNLELPESVYCCKNIPDAINLSQKLGKIPYIIGGGQIYEESLKLVNKMYLTIINKKYEVDTFFPDYEKTFSLISKENIFENNDVHFCVFKRK